MKSFIYQVSFVCLVIFFACTLNMSSTCAQAWPHFGADSGMTAYAAGETAISAATVPNMTKQWGIGCNGSYYAQFSRTPAIWNGRLYVVGEEGALECYDAKSGANRWNYGGTMGSWCPQPSVTSNGTVLYLLSDSSNYSLKAVNGTTGALIWTAPLQFDLGFNDSAVICLDEPRNQVLLLECPFEPDSGKLYALSLETGQVNWYMSKALNGFSFTGDYLVRDGSTVYAGIIQDENWSRERIGVINLLTQQLQDVWTKPAEGSDVYIKSLTLCNDALAVAFTDWNHEATELAIYNTSDGSTAWSFPSPHLITGDIAYNPVLDRLYLPTNPRLYAFDLDQTPGNVQPAWTWTGFDEIYSPSIANGVVFFLSDTNAYAVNETTGTIIRTIPLGASADETTQVAICEGMIYFSGNGGTCKLFAYGFKEPCDTLGVTIYMPSHNFAWMDPCSCSVTICNPGSTTYSNVPLFVILDVYGMLLFAPGFSTVPQWYTINPAPDETEVVVLPEFNWPPATGTASGIIWYSAMTNPAMTDLFGEMDTWTFGWE